MTDSVMDIEHWDNTLSVRMPTKIAGAAQLRADQQVRLWVGDGRVVIESVGAVCP